MYAGTNSIGTTALELHGNYGLRFLSSYSNVYLEGNGAHITIGYNQNLSSAGVFVGPNLYTDSGTPYTTSDRNKKHDIEYDIEQYDNLFDDLKPVRFKYNNGTSNRYHTGLIANDVKDAIVNNGLTTQEFAAYGEIPVLAQDENGNNIDEVIGHTCVLRYEEFVPLNIWQIQRLKERTLELEKQVTMLTEQLSKLNLND